MHAEDSKVKLSLAVVYCSTLCCRCVHTAAMTRDAYTKCSKLAFKAMTTKKRCQMNAPLVITKSRFHKADLKLQR